MNIFYLDHNMMRCGEAHVDKHVVKMPLEALQICSTALYVVDKPIYDRLALYKPTHTKHPIVRWAIENPAMIGFIACYGLCVSYEYTRRYKKRVHACADRLSAIYSAYYVGDRYAYTLPQCMPDEFKDEYNPIQAYRNYYANGKSHLHKWSTRTEPSWLASSRRTAAVGS